MVCTASSDQLWVATSSPTTTSSSSAQSRPRESSRDRWDEATDVNDARDEELATALDHASRLTTDVVVTDDDGRCLASSRRCHVAAGADCATSEDDVRHCSTDPEAEHAGDATAREQRVEDQLARVLVDLASEQRNVCLAANAGNALLAELGAARNELDSAQDVLETVQLERDEAVRETQRLYDRTVALETTLQRYNVPYESWSTTGLRTTLSHEQQMQQQQQTLLLTSCRGVDPTDACERCATRGVHMLQLEQRLDAVNRRCLQSELVCEREQLRRHELEQESAQLQQQTDEQRLEILRARKECELLTAQSEQQTQELDSARAGRDTLRRTVRRLEGETNELRARVSACDECIQKLEACKARATTQLQVAENRTASARVEAERATKTLEHFQKQFMQVLEQQQRERESSTGWGRSCDADVDLCESKVMEQLLQDATREVAALRLENRVLRQRHSSRSRSDERQVRDQRRKLLGSDDRDSSITTAACVLALDSYDREHGDPAKSKRDSRTEPHVSSDLQRSSLERDTSGSIVAPANRLPSDEELRRKMSWTMDWVDNTPSIRDDAAAKNDENRAALHAHKQAGPTPRAVESKPEHCDVVRHEKQLEIERDTDSELSTSTTSPQVKRPVKLSTRCRVTDHGSTFNAYDRKIEEAGRLSIAGENVYTRVRGLSVEESRGAGLESPPSSPLYFGLSFIACATAATAASLLARR